MSKQDETLQRLLDEVKAELEAHFESLTSLQTYFIEACSSQGRLLFIENYRFDADEQHCSDAYKIKVALQKVLAVEYTEEVDVTTTKGSTETIYAVIVIPKILSTIIEEINKHKTAISELLNKTKNGRYKEEGQLIGVNKIILREVGKPRANLNQIRRKINALPDIYSRISFSGTKQRPVYSKSYAEVLEMLKKFSSEQSQIDKKTLAKYKNEPSFAFFYEEVYDSMVANMKYRDDVELDENGLEIIKQIKPKKVSSPIYILSDDIKATEIEIKHKVKKENKSPKAREDKIVSEQILQSLPVHLSMAK